MFKEGQTVLYRDCCGSREAVIVCEGSPYCCIKFERGNKKKLVKRIVPISDLKPFVKTIRVGEFDVPEPLREAPHEGTKVYIAYIYPYKEINFFNYTSGTLHEVYLQRGLIHLTVEAATLHAKALLSFTTTEQ